MNTTTPTYKLTISTKLAIAAIALAGFGYGFAAAIAQDAPNADPKARPVFPAAKVERVESAPVVPAGAQYRVRSGKGVRYVACDSQRQMPGQVELRCLSWNVKKGWSKSPKWLPRYQLFSLTGPIPAEGQASPL